MTFWLFSCSAVGSTLSRLSTRAVSCFRKYNVTTADNIEKRSQKAHASQKCRVRAGAKRHDRHGDLKPDEAHDSLPCEVRLEEALHRTCTLRSQDCIYTYMSAKTSPFTACRNCSCSALRRASRAVTQHYEACFRGTGLRATQFTLLAVLAQTGPLPISVLAAKLGLERTSLTRNLRPLEKKGFVETVLDDDRRIRRIRITKRGETAALGALNAWKRAQSSVEGVLRRSGIRDLMVTPGA